MDFNTCPSHCDKVNYARQVEEQVNFTKGKKMHTENFIYFCNFQVFKKPAGPRPFKSSEMKDNYVMITPIRDEPVIPPDRYAKCEVK